MSETPIQQSKQTSLWKDFLFLSGICAAVVVIRSVILPALGIPTCAGGSCALPSQGSPEEFKQDVVKVEKPAQP